MAESPTAWAERPIRWNSIVLLVTPLGVPLIRKLYRSDFWTLPGGGDYPSDPDPRATALREFEEETGMGLREIDPEGEILKEAFREERQSRLGQEIGDDSVHQYCLFAGATRVLPKRNRPKTGEKVLFFPTATFMDDRDFFRPQREFLERNEVVDGIRRALAA